MNLSRPFLPHFKEWPCSRCTLINSRTKYFCTACGTAYTKPPKPEKEKKRKEDTTRSEFGLDELSSKSSRPRRPSPPNRLESSGTLWMTSRSSLIQARGSVLYARCRIKAGTSFVGLASLQNLFRVIQMLSEKRTT